MNWIAQNHIKHWSSQLCSQDFQKGGLHRWVHASMHYKNARGGGGSGGMLPQEIFEILMLWDCFWGHSGTARCLHASSKNDMTPGASVDTHYWRWLNRRLIGELSSAWNGIFICAGICVHAFTSVGLPLYTRAFRFHPLVLHEQKRC